MDSSEVGVEESYCVRKAGEDSEADLELPVIAKGGDREKLVAEMKIDPTLEHVRGIAERREKVYLWKSDLLMLELCNVVLEIVKVTVLSK